LKRKERETRTISGPELEQRRQEEDSCEGRCRRYTADRELDEVFPSSTSPLVEKIFFAPSRGLRLDGLSSNGLITALPGRGSRRSPFPAATSRNGERRYAVSIPAARITVEISVPYRRERNPRIMP